MTTATQHPRIGLALSGGGFRASIFHLGVIRRLEELGIMKDVGLVSSVSGGSIIAAFYIVEMEIRLRQRREELTAKPELLDAVRLELFEQIAAQFFVALDHNLRTRALIFSPFYHPLKFLKSLTPGYSRSDLMQSELDHFFYHGNTLDQLPAVMHKAGDEEHRVTDGPRLVLNTTSLMTGERVGFSREPLSGLKQQQQVNKNVLRLSQTVGASACVPGLFPPVPVSGELLVDGGISDNQGIEALLAPFGQGGSEGDDTGYDVLLVSDASGQMEQVDRQSSSAAAVVGRTLSILQFQVRKKLLDILQQWKDDNDQPREFAFIHLFMNLKDRPGAPRVPSEYIPGIARIRTDLDQFGVIEREALMYHAYTLVDSQIRQHCPLLSSGVGSPDLKRPPLFDNGDEAPTPTAKYSFRSRRERIKEVLEAGSQKVFLLRSLAKYRFRAGIVLAVCLVLPVAALYGVWVGGPWVSADTDAWLLANIGKPVAKWLEGSVPGALAVVSTLVGADNLRWPITSLGLAKLVVMGLGFYLFSFVAYVVMRRRVRRWDLRDYRRLTGDQEPSTHW